MLANFLSKSKPINFIGLLIFFFFNFFITVFSSFFTDGFSINVMLKSGILALLFFTIFFIFNFINTRNNLTFDNSYAYFLFIVLVVLLLSDLINYNILVKMTVYLLFLRKIYSLKSNKKTIAKLFDSGFWLGIFFILEPVVILLFILIYLSIYLHNKITIHTLFTPLMGFISPLVIFFTYNFWFDKTEEFTRLFYFDTRFSTELYVKSKYIWVIGTTFFLTVFAMIFKSSKVLSVNNTFRKNWILLITNFFLLILLTILIPQKTESELIYILFPIAIILANGIELIEKKQFKDMILYFFLIGCVCFQFLL